MKEDRFVSKNIDKWHSLEEYNKRLSKKGIGCLSQEEIRDFARLYRNLSHNMAYAKTHFPESNITVYLNQIIGTAHNFIFVREEKGAKGFKDYFTKTAPIAIKNNMNYFTGAFLIFMAGFIFCMALVLIEPYYGNYFFPDVAVGDLNLSPEGNDSWSYAFLSSFIMTNNIRVSFLAFALGITAGVGTTYVLFYNGMVLGALTAIVVEGGASVVSYASMILPHGFIELAAIFIAGGAGLLIGKGLLIPGELKRKDSIIKYAKKAAALIPLIVAMLIIAGLIEGFFTPLALNPVVKLLFSFLTLFAMIAYYNFFTRKV